MLYHIGIENNVEGRSQAWALDFPGCFAYGRDADGAISAMPDAIANYHSWIASRNQDRSWLESGDIELCLDETWDVYAIDSNMDLAEQGYEVNAWFRHDWKPLTGQDVVRALQLLSWSRADLLDSVKGLTALEMDADRSGERWSIAGILRHVGGAEWWYLDRLGLIFPKENVPGDPFERLKVVRAVLIDALPTLVDSPQVVGVDGEFWSPRKLVRRAIWHERDHTHHIHKLR